MAELSNIFSRAILQALEDLEKAEAHPDYRVEMLFWHRPCRDGVCEVCLAGSVMAFRLGALRDHGMTPSFFPGDVRWKLRALEYLRTGHIEKAALDFDVNPRTAAELDRRFWCMPSYDESPRDFKADLRAIAEAAAEMGA